MRSMFTLKEICLHCGHEWKQTTENLVFNFELVISFNSYSLDTVTHTHTQPTDCSTRPLKRSVTRSLMSHYTRLYNMRSPTRALRACGSREVTAVASWELAAGQSSGGSVSPFRSESGAPLPPKQPLRLMTKAACLPRSQLWRAARPARCPQT